MGSVLLHVLYGFVGLSLFVLVPILVGIPINWFYGVCDKVHREEMENTGKGAYAFLCYVFGLLAIVGVFMLYMLGTAIEFVYRGY